MPKLGSWADALLAAVVTIVAIVVWSCVAWLMLAD